MIIRRSLASLAIITTMLFALLLASPVARADTDTRVLHRTYSQIPTIRLWDTDSANDLDQTQDVSRGETCCNPNSGFAPDWLYVPQSWCAEVNIYWNNTFIQQSILTGGKFWSLRYHYFHSVYIFNPGADGICN